MTIIATSHSKLHICRLNNTKALLEFSRISIVIIVIFIVSLPKAVKVVFIRMMQVIFSHWEREGLPMLGGNVSNLHHIAAGGCESRLHKGGSCLYWGGSCLCWEGSCPCWGGSGGRSNLCRCSPVGGGRGAEAEVESWVRVGGSSHHLP